MLESGQMDIAALKSHIAKWSIWLAQAGFVAGSAFASVHFSLGEVKTTASELKVEMKETRADIAALRNETKADIAALRNETKADIAALRNETKADIAALRNETKADIKRLENLIRENNRRTDQKIDGLSQKLNHRIDQLYELLNALQSSRDQHKAAVKVSALSAAGCLVCASAFPAHRPMPFSTPFLVSLIMPTAGMNSRPSASSCPARGFIAVSALSLIFSPCVSARVTLSPVYHPPRQRTSLAGVTSNDVIH